MTKVMPDMQQVAIWAYRAAGAGLAIALMEALAQFAGEPVLRVPFVTSIVLTLALPESEPAQPYALIAGHLLSDPRRSGRAVVSRPGNDRRGGRGRSGNT